MGNNIKTLKLEKNYLNTVIQNSNFSLIARGLRFPVTAMISCNKAYQNIKKLSNNRFS